MKKLINVDLREELGKKRDASIDNANMNANVHEVKKLLAGREREEREILREAGLDHNINKVEKELGINLERERFEERIGENVFTEDEIREICLKYNLKFLKSDRYKGSIEPQLGAKILRFFESKKIDSAKYEAHNCLYILAPFDAFNLDEKPVPPRPRKDPAIFYKMTGPRETGTYYVMIHKWGNDFTVFRRILGALRENKWNWCASTMLFITLGLMSVFALAGFNPFNWQAIAFSAAVSFLYVLIGYGTRMGWTADNTSTDTTKQTKFNLRFSRHGWNSYEK